jgi:membrane associated rhomboid family serine protease
MSRPLSLRWTLGQTPRAVRWLIVVTAVVSIAAVVSARNGASIPMAGLLVVPEVFRGQVWRLVTWVFYEMSPLALVFNCLTLYWIGSDVARTLGRRAFLVSYFGLAAIAAAVTSLVGQFVWPLVASIAFGGSWPVLCGLLVAWGMMFPDRPLRFWGLPLMGRHLIPITLGGTVLFALFSGLALFIPHFTTELVALAWLGPIRRALVARKKDLVERAARGEAWSFDAWFEKEKRRRK